MARNNQQRHLFQSQEYPSQPSFSYPGQGTRVPSAVSQENFVVYHGQLHYVPQPRPHVQVPPQIPVPPMEWYPQQPPRPQPIQLHPVGHQPDGYQASPPQVPLARQHLLHGPRQSLVSQQVPFYQGPDQVQHWVPGQQEASLPVGLSAQQWEQLLHQMQQLFTEEHRSQQQVHEVVTPPEKHQSQQVHEVVTQHQSQQGHRVLTSPGKRDGWYGAIQESFEDRVTHDIDIKEIRVELNVQTYKKKFNNLICWEEKSNIDILGRKCDRKCDMTLFQCGAPPSWIRSHYAFKVSMRYGFLKNLTADQIAYVTQACEAVFIVSKDRYTQLRAEILKENYRHSDEKLYVAFREDESFKLSQINYALSLTQGETIVGGLLVEFEVKHGYFNSLVKAVNSMHEGVIRRLLPTAADFFEPTIVTECYLKVLLSEVPCNIIIDDDSQFNALRTIVSCNRSSPPLIVNGSFGTGKTRLLAVATHCLLDNGIRSTSPTRILVCAHHYNSVDNFIEKYFGKMFGEGSEVDLFRLIDDVYINRGSRYSNLHKTAKDMQEYFNSHDTMEYLLVVTEFLTAQSLLNIFEEGFFTHILLDEGSQIVEPQAIAALSLAGPNTKIVIVGDSCQVGPSLNVLGDEAREHGLKYSLQERLQELYRKLGGLASKHIVSLNTNYRCHESIIQIPNALFYEGKIASSALDAVPHHQAKFPLVFVCSSLSGKVDCDLEAKLLLDNMEHFVISNWPDGWGERDWDICLTTASQTQLVITRTLSRKRYRNLSQFIKILTTYGIQGTEFQAMFLSTAEPVDSVGNTTNPTKSPCDPYVFNTALTRSKSLVVAVGSPVALLRIEEHMVKKYGRKAHCWSSYMKLCLEKDTFIIPSEIEPNERIRKDFISKLSNRIPRTVSDTKGGGTKLTNLSSTNEQGIAGHRSYANAVTSHATAFPTQIKPMPRALADSSLLGNRKKPRKSRKKNLKTSPISSLPVASSINSPPMPSMNKALADSTSLGNRNQPGHQHLPWMKTTAPAFPVSPSSLGYRRNVEPSEKRLPAKTSPLVMTLPPRNTVQSQVVARECLPQPAMISSYDSTHSANVGSQVSPPRMSREGDTLLKEDLTVDNYKEKFRLLLEEEQQEHRKLLTERCNNVYEVELFKTEFIPRNLSYEDDVKYVRFGCITSNDGDILAYAKQASGSSLITVGDCCVRARHVQGKLPEEKVYSNAILIAFDQEQYGRLKIAHKHEECKFKADIKFEFQEFYFKMQHNAIENISDDIVQKLNPSKEVFSSYEQVEFSPVSRPPYESIELDEYAQMSALYLILKSSPDLPVLITGSFGTGKTRLLARAAFEILKKGKSRVLICAHHQSSVDTFVNYFDKMKNSRKKNAWKAKMIRVIPNDSCTRYGKYERSKYALTMRELENYQLVLTTFGTASSLFKKVLQNQRKREGFFTDVLIDEGAQIRESEMVAALMLAGTKTRIVMAGDHYQVGPNTLVLGKKARDGGLGVSPLERLHRLYDKEKNLLSDSCSITLLTNYRCHSSILMLPSSLYYQSTLTCAAKSITHPFAPFPLTFVCSNIEQDFNGTSGVNERGANVLIKEVEKYFEKWPVAWKGREKKICIIAPSPNQLGLLKKKSKFLKIDLEIQCHTLAGYNIQGTEFEAIFISTSEPTTDQCEPLNATKSICDRFVFNTVLTRSRSLVVAVGNPFLLLKMEESMIKKHNDPSYSTWKPYIRQCLECNSFSYSKDIEKSDIDATTHQLYECVYSDSTLTSSDLQNYCDSKFKDSILENYQKVFESKRGCKNMKLILSSDKDAQLTWNLNENDHKYQKPEEEKISYSDKYLCKLKFLTYRTAEAAPVSDTSKKTVEIHGKKNLKYAFDGDTVMVGVFDDCPPDKQYGRVIKVTKRGSNLKYICRVADYNPIVFIPIDKKNPKLINLPTLSRVILRMKRREQIDKKSDFEYNDVFVFDPNSNEKDTDGIHLPRVVQVIPHAVAQKMLFLISFVMWKKKNSNPLGIVIGACSLGHTLLKAELLLKLEHSVTFNSSDDFKDSHDPVEDTVFDPNLHTNKRAFTIDPSDAQNLDDALSIISQGSGRSPSPSPSPSPKVYQLGVHIVNAAKHIIVDSEEDVAAKRCGISVYGGKKGGKMMYMLGNRNTRNALSLFPGKLRDVISVTCDVTMDDSQHNIDIGTSDINPTQIQSAFKLSYEHAQDLMRDRIPPQHAPMVRTFDGDPQNPSLCKSLKLLYVIAMAMRQTRLKSNSAFVNNVDDFDEVKNWQAHLLVEELMIWANNEVAKKLHSDFPNAAILCKQEPPNENKLEEIIEQYKDTISGSLHLSRYLRETGYQHLENNFTHIKMPYNILNRALHVQESDHLSLAYLLSSERLYPQLAAVASKFPLIFKRSEYCCAEENECNPSAYRHYSLCLDKYAHFTSPIRRYVDIVVQRMLLQQSDLSHEELKKLCIAFNNSKKNASSYEKAIGRVRLACKLLSNSEVCTAYVSKQDSNSVKLVFPDPDMKYKDISSAIKTLEISRCFPYAKDYGVYTWKLRVTSLSKDYAAKLLQQPNYTVSRHTATIINSKADLLKAFCSSDDKKLDIKQFLAIPQESNVEISPRSWLTIQKFIKQPDKEELFHNVKKVLKRLPSRPSPKLSTSNTNFLFLDCDVKLPLGESDPVRLWLSWSTREPIISPAIQLVEVSPLLRICVQHNTHPAECFSDPDLQQASRKEYHSIKHYVVLWKKVLLAEAAVKSVHECQPIVIRGVHLEWPELETLDECIEVQYHVPTDFIKMVLPGYFIDNCSEFFRIRIGDLVCARYGCDQDDRVRAVCHFVVHDVQRSKEESKQEETVIFLKAIGKVNCQVPSKIAEKLKSKDEKYLCEIQIVPMSISYRKVFRGLLDLANHKGTSLSRRVAVNSYAIRGQHKYPNHTKDIANIKKKDELAMSISKWEPPSESSLILNDGQNRAMEQAIMKEFQLIQGPPGTGKSVTGAHIAYVLAKLNLIINTGDTHKCVLYCGPSNKSVDVVFRKFADLLETRKKMEVRILRIYSSAVERKDFLGPNYQTQQALPDNACPEWARPYSLHHLIRRPENTEVEFAALKELEQKLEDMERNKQIANGKLCNEYRRVLSNAEEKFLTQEKNFDIVFCTCNEASGGRMKRHWRLLTPRQCIIDECGMAYEPETIVPLGLCEHAVLIGDHMQLQPVIEYRPAREHGLITSLFERYAKHYEHHIFKLTIQYRMHKAICAFPSKEFYDDGLKTAPSVKNRPDNKDLENFWPRGNEYPIMFVDVVGEEGKNIENSKREAKVGVDSKYNEKEAKLVIEIAKILHYSHKVPLEEIAVLTPYSAQKNKILIMVKKVDDISLRNLKVASITESQGDEYGYVILSTVRSQPLEEIKHRHYIQPDRSWMAENLGFITDKHQINVGITRSKYGLIITGNKTLLEYDSTWKHLLDHYTEKGCVEKDSRFLPHHS